MSTAPPTGDAKRRISIRREGDDFVVAHQDFGVVYRHHDIDELRRACQWLRWDIDEDLEVIQPAQSNVQVLGITIQTDEPKAG